MKRLLITLLLCFSGYISLKAEHGNRMREVELNNRTGRSHVQQSINHSDGVRIYPNPAKEQLWIETETDSRKYYRILDAMGREVLNGTLQGKQSVVNIVDLNRGVYTIKVLDSEQVQTLQFVKSND
jgi:hypothetical protein